MNALRALGRISNSTAELAPESPDGRRDAAARSQILRRAAGSRTPFQKIAAALSGLGPELSVRLEGPNLEQFVVREVVLHGTARERVFLLSELRALLLDPDEETLATLPPKLENWFDIWIDKREKFTFMADTSVPAGDLPPTAVVGVGTGTLGARIRDACRSWFRSDREPSRMAVLSAAQAAATMSSLEGRVSVVACREGFLLRGEKEAGITYEGVIDFTRHLTPERTAQMALWQGCQLSPHKFVLEKLENTTEIPLPSQDMTCTEEGRKNLRRLTELATNLTDQDWAVLAAEAERRAAANRVSMALETSESRPMLYKDRPASEDLITFLRREYRDKGILKQGFNKATLRKYDPTCARAIDHYEATKQPLPHDVQIPTAYAVKSRKQAMENQ
jgi:hypothetical protein